MDTEMASFPEPAVDALQTHTGFIVQQESLLDQAQLHRDPSAISRYRHAIQNSFESAGSQALDLHQLEDRVNHQLPPNRHVFYASSPKERQHINHILELAIEAKGLNPSVISAQELDDSAALSHIYRLSQSHGFTDTRFRRLLDSVGLHLNDLDLEQVQRSSPDQASTDDFIEQVQIGINALTKQPVITAADIHDIEPQLEIKITSSQEELDELFSKLRAMWADRAAPLPPSNEHTQAFHVALITRLTQNSLITHHDAVLLTATIDEMITTARETGGRELGQGEIENEILRLTRDGPIKGNFNWARLKKLGIDLEGETGLLRLLGYDPEKVPHAGTPA